MKKPPTKKTILCHFTGLIRARYQPQFHRILDRFIHCQSSTAVKQGGVEIKAFKQSNYGI
uniref:Uncharacterized protein n=1 Tax=Rousettus aegyptiacus TaxID=9407 RepID=A0A7J8B8A1_ROUAE|nr:hypothetical protein HJG63_001759 [Rousettus aegyptiacus]